MENTLFYFISLNSTQAQLKSTGYLKSVYQTHGRTPVFSIHMHQLVDCRIRNGLVMTTEPSCFHMEFTFILCSIDF